MNTFDANTPTEELLRQLADARKRLEMDKEAMKSIIDESKMLERYVKAEISAKVTSEKIDIVTAEIKERALQAFQASGEKKPFEGVTVKVFKVFSVKEPTDMEEWVQVNLAAAVKRTLDMKVIEAFAKNSPVPGTVITEEARAEIASKLP